MYSLCLSGYMGVLSEDVGWLSGYKSDTSSLDLHEEVTGRTNKKQLAVNRNKAAAAKKF